MPTGIGKSHKAGNVELENGYRDSISRKGTAFSAFTCFASKNEPFLDPNGCSTEFREDSLEHRGAASDENAT